MMRLSFGSLIAHLSVSNRYLEPERTTSEDLPIFNDGINCSTRILHAAPCHTFIFEKLLCKRMPRGLVSDSTRRTVLKVAAGIGGVLSLGSTSAVAQSNEIEDWNDLDAVRETLDGDHELVADLDEATAGYDEHVANPPAGFDPIGNEENPFTGTFDGSGNEISGLQIDVPSDDQVGLFGHIRRGTVTDVTLTEVDVTGGSSVGGLVGFNTAPATEEGPHGITNADVSGSVSGTNRVGGIVGLNRTSAEVTDSTAACEVVADGNSVGGLIGAHNGDIISESAATGSVDGEFNTGGFVGVNFNNIKNCHATGDVEGETTGGFAGGNDSGAEITRSYATGDVTSNGRAGGFAGGNAGGTITESFAAGTVSGGENAGGFVSRNGNEFAEEDGFRAEITDCYAVGEVTGDERVGGFVGHNFFGDVEQSYAGGDVSGSESVGGFVGVNRDGSTVNNVYWDATTAETSDGGTALTTTEMQGTDAAVNMAALDFEETWDVVTDNYPKLAWQDEPVEQPEDGRIAGDVTITLDNVGSSAWQATSIDGDEDVAPLNENNPTLTLEPGTRYVIENNGWDAHPLAFRDEAGEELLTQDGDGKYETDSAVEWVDEDDELAFTLTDDLAAEVEKYICTIHSSMRESVTVEEAESGPALGDYQDDSGDTSTDLLLTGIDDWRNDEITTDLLLKVINSWRNS
jgi:hypothetical protein